MYYKDLPVTPVRFSSPVYYKDLPVTTPVGFSSPVYYKDLPVTPVGFPLLCIIRLTCYPSGVFFSCVL